MADGITAALKKSVAVALVLNDQRFVSNLNLFGMSCQITHRFQAKQLVLCNLPFHCTTPEHFFGQN